MTDRKGRIMFAYRHGDLAADRLAQQSLLTGDAA